MKKTKIGILGVGAIGSVMASQLFDHPNVNLFYFNRSPKTKIRLQAPQRFFDFKIKVETNFFEKMELDWLIICLKEYHFQSAQNWFEKLISPKTKIAIIRNGIELKEPLLVFAKENQILECMINCPTQPSKNNDYQQLSIPIITIPQGDLATNFQHLFKSREIQFRQVKDFNTENWKKLLESASLGAITCLTGETCWIFEDEKIISLFQKLLKEGIQVAKADGATLQNNFVEVMLAKIKTYPKEKGTSMLTDRKLGRPIELGAKNGAIVNVGKKYKIDTPLNDLVYTLLGKINQA